MKCTKYITNSGKGDGKGSGQKMIMLKLPISLEVNKIVYGVRLGIQANKNEIVYYDKFQMFEKEVMEIKQEGKHLCVTYKKRKNNPVVILDKYQVRIPEVVLLLYGKGDSIIIHE